MRYLAAELGRDNIRVNAISAGPMQTLSARGISQFSLMLKYYEEHAPLRRSSSLDELGAAGLYLMTEGASAINGKTIFVDGGYSIIGMPGTNVRLEIAQDETAEFLQAMPAPKMIPILSNYAFSKRIMDVWDKEYSGARPAAIVLENHKAGGHNAPSRNKESFTEQDDLESYFEKVVKLGVPVYVAGTFEHGATRADFEHWTARGAYGLQVGSRFALCKESGMREDLHAKIIGNSERSEVDVSTSPLMSPTGYPLKVARVADTISEPEVYAARQRVCDKKYLLKSHFQEQPDGTTKETYICSAMPPEEYVRLGGDIADTPDKACLCNGLLSTAGYYDDVEPAVVTLGASGRHVTEHISAREIVEDILTPDYVAKKAGELALPVA